jgi:beta-lactamase regulating signal transducer with metallopeptidase domain
MMAALDIVARIAAERMLNSVVAGIVLTMLAWALLRLVGPTNARTRVAVWLSVLLAVPALLVSSIFNTGSSPLLPSSARIVVSEHWALAMFVSWTAIAGLALLRVVFGLLRIHRIRQQCSSLDISGLDPSTLGTIERCRPHRAVSLLKSETARVPIAIGFFKPAIILPEWTLAELSPAELSAVFIHEFAHLSRWDDWTNFFQKVLRALLFFHPALWWLDRRLALDREIACDDIVVRAMQDAHGYAACLVDLAEKSLLRRGLAMAQAAVHSARHISLRIAEILDPACPRATRVSKAALSTVTALACACLLAVLHSPTLIAFQDNAGDVQASQSTVRVVPGVAQSLLGPKVIPASLRETSSKLRRVPAKAAHSANHVNSVQNDVVAQAKFAVRAQPRPKVLRASVSAQQPPIIPMETMLVVTRDASIDFNGRVVLTVSVWRLAVFHPAQDSVQQASIAKSI